MNDNYKPVQYLTVGSEDSGRRIDNFLMARLKQVPKTRVYRMLRKGEVRLNGGRVRQDRKLNAGDVLRIPPLYEQPSNMDAPPDHLVRRVMASIIFENDLILAINKPAGISVHGGSRDTHGIIEALRAGSKAYQGLHLAHRLDRMTSGCLLLCKRMDTLRQVNQLIRQGDTTKKYLTLVKGRADDHFSVNLPLKKGTLRGGERMVGVDHSGKAATSLFTVVRHYNSGTLMEVELVTGRTHQIRVHAAESGHPVAMDNKYGEIQYNREMKRLGLKRMFLHASSLSLHLPGETAPVVIEAPLPSELQNFLVTLAREDAEPIKQHQRNNQADRI